MTVHHHSTTIWYRNKKKEKKRKKTKHKIFDSHAILNNYIRLQKYNCYCKK